MTDDRLADNPDPMEIVFSEPPPASDKLVSCNFTRAQLAVMAEGLRLYLALGEDIDARIALAILLKELNK